PASPTHRSSDLYNLLSVPCSGHQHPRRRATGEPDQENVYIVHNFKWHIVRLDRRRQRATGEPDQGKCVCYTQFSVAQPCRQPLRRSAAPPPSTSAPAFPRRRRADEPPPSSTSSPSGLDERQRPSTSRSRRAPPSSTSAPAFLVDVAAAAAPPTPGSDNSEALQTWV